MEKEYFKELINELSDHVALTAKSLESMFSQPNMKILTEITYYEEPKDIVVISDVIGVRTEDLSTEYMKSKDESGYALADIVFKVYHDHTFVDKLNAVALVIKSQMTPTTANCPVLISKPDKMKFV